MGMPKQRQAGFTRSDWQDWEGRWELLDGIAYDMTPAPSVEHQSMVADIYFSMRESLEEAKKKSGGRCRIFFAPNTFRGDRLDALDQPVTHSVFKEARPTSPLAPAKKSGEAILFGLDVFLAENVLQPDILVVCDPEKVHDHGMESQLL